MEDNDPELENIRQRRLQALMASRSEQTAPPKSVERPARQVEVSTAMLDVFLSQNPVAVVNLWTAWAAPCRQMTQMLEELAGTMGPGVAFAKVNADEEPQVVARYGVEGVPTVLAFLNGRLAGKWVGVRPKEDMEVLIRRTLLGEGGQIKIQKRHEKPKILGVSDNDKTQ